jgi:hypothetical protein
MNRQARGRRWLRAFPYLCLAIFIALVGCARPAANAHVAARGARTPSATPARGNTNATTTKPALTVVVDSVVLTSGSHLDFSGSGFTPGAVLDDIRVEDAHAATELQLPPAYANVAGNLPAESFVLPTSLSPGTHWLVVKGTASHDVARAQLQVHRLPPTIKLDTYSTEPGYSFGVSGQGFVSREPVRVYLGSMTSAPIAVLTAGVGGNLVGRVSVPSLTAGVYTLYVAGQVSGTPAAVTFNVRAFKPWVVLDDWTPKAGASVTASGQDFAPNEQVFVFLNAVAGQPLATITADATGSFTHVAAIVVPDSSTGRQTLIFVGAHSRVQASTAFDITP